MFDPIYNVIGWALAQLYALIPNFGVSIILLTLIIMGLLFPLTAKQAKSMIAMQRVQPEIKKLQAKHKGDRQKLNEEMMKFYQENKINPLAGCLPLLIQMPVFFALFRVLREPYSHLPVGSKLYDAFCHTANGVATVKQCGTLPRLPHHLYFLGMDLSTKATALTPTCSPGCRTTSLSGSSSSPASSSRNRPHETRRRARTSRCR